MKPPRGGLQYDVIERRCARANNNKMLGGFNKPRTEANSKAKTESELLKVYTETRK